MTCRAARQTESWVSQHHKLAGETRLRRVLAAAHLQLGEPPWIWSLADSHRDRGRLLHRAAADGARHSRADAAHGFCSCRGDVGQTCWPGRQRRPCTPPPACLRDSASASSLAWRSVATGTESTLRRRLAGTSNNVVPGPESSTSCSTTAPADSARTPSETTTASSSDVSGPAAWRTWSRCGWARQRRARAEVTGQGARQLAGAWPHLL